MSKRIRENYLYLVYFFIPGLLSTMLISCRTNNDKVDVSRKLSTIQELKETSLKGPQQFNLEGYRLKITGTVMDTLSLSYREIIDSNRIHRRTARLKCVEDWSARPEWEGVKVMDILNKAKIKPESRRVIFHGVDEYTTSLSLDYLKDNEIIMAYKVNGVKLPDSLGFPFQIVAEGKWGYKWAKWISRIEVTSDTTYQGFWESKSLDRNADTTEHFLKEKYRKYYEK